MKCFDENNSPFNLSCSLRIQPSLCTPTACRIWAGETSALYQQQFHTDDENLSWTQSGALIGQLWQLCIIKMSWWLSFIVYVQITNDSWQKIKSTTYKNIITTCSKILAFALFLIFSSNNAGDIKCQRYYSTEQIRNHSVGFVFCWAAVCAVYTDTVAVSIILITCSVTSV